ncbi:hypothetical protein EfmJHP36_11630 [Enterococcus faecium]|nr:hypothetical protein EfmJHP36_11630 [Enterococcus faecium]
MTQEQGEELLAWATRQSYETLLSLYNGYEVEKEPLWAIKNADGNYLTKCALWGKDGVNYSFECNPSHRLLFYTKLSKQCYFVAVYCFLIIHTITKGG